MTIEPRTSSTSLGATGGHQPANLGDILERVLDRGVVIVGDIRISLLDIELLTVKLRLLIASVDTARELGIDWWEHDPWVSSRARDGRVARSQRSAAVGRADRREIESEDDEPAPLRGSDRPQRGIASYQEPYDVDDRDRFR